MIEINIYRSRIGTFYHHKKTKTDKFKKFYQFHQSSSYKAGQEVLSSLTQLVKVALIFSLLPSFQSESDDFLLACSTAMAFGSVLPATAHLSCCLAKVVLPTQSWRQYQTRGKKQSTNFLTRYLYGNRKKGILNLHLNIRSLKNKVTEVKNIIKQYNPHIFGLSECELKKVNNIFDEKILKIPGYSLLFPKSWSSMGQARVVMYVKKTFEFEQVPELEDEEVQSIWIRGGFKNSKKIYYCHGYREHTSLSKLPQDSNLEMFLSQWESATALNNPAEPNEVHVSGDMNLDSLGDRWHKSDYHLATLSQLVHSCCNVCNFTQLVTGVTRVQYNSVRAGLMYHAWTMSTPMSSTGAQQ